MYSDIGKKIRYFRLRGGLSQLDLELALGAAQGSISRMESGRVNPTKETINHIADILKLNNREHAFLLFDSNQDIPKEEVEEAKALVKDHFAKASVYAYLLDDRFRFWDFSQGFIKLFTKMMPSGEVEKFKEGLRGTSVIKALIDPTFGLVQFFPQGKEYEDMLYLQLSRDYFERRFMMEFDPTVKSDIELISRTPVANRIWQRVLRDPGNVNSLPSKEITFVFKGMKIKMNYARERLSSNPRFETIEYIPNNKLVRLLSKYV